MANISNANGILNIYIKDKNLEQVDKFLVDLNKLTSEWYYGTTFVLDTISKVSEELYTVEFFGYGRWGYFTNIEWFAKDNEINKIYLDNDINDMRLIFLYHDTDQAMDSYCMYITSVVDITRMLSDLGNIYYKNSVTEMNSGSQIDVRNSDDNMILQREIREHYFPYSGWYDEEDEDEVEVKELPKPKEEEEKQN